MLLVRSLATLPRSYAADGTRCVAAFKVAATDTVMDWGPYNTCVLHYALFIVRGPMRLLLCMVAASWLACLWARINVFAVHMI